MDVIEQLITEDQDFYLDSRYPPTVETFPKKEKRILSGPITTELPMLLFFVNPLKDYLNIVLRVIVIEIQVKEKLKKYKDWQSLRNAND